MEPIPNPGGLITQETSSPPSSARYAAAIGGAREGRPSTTRACEPLIMSLIGTISHCNSQNLDVHRFL